MLGGCAVIERPLTLKDVLEQKGILPVGWEELVAHKEAQRKRFGPSFWYRYQALISVGRIVMGPVIGLSAAAVNGFSPAWNWLAIGITLASMCMVPLLTGTGIIRVRAGSHWQERIISLGKLAEVGVPASVMDLARELVAELPRPVLVLGELVREEAILDPYLLIENGDQRACLGIWDNALAQPLIAVAQVA